VLCSIKEEDDRLASIYRRFLRVSAFVIFPLMTGLAAVAEPLVLLLLKEQWLFCATLLTIICFSMMWYPVHSINLNLLQVKGRSDLFLRLEIIKKILGVVILCVTLPMGLIAMCIGGIFSTILCLVINTHYTGKLIRVGFLVQIRDLFPALLLSLSMSAVVYGTIHVLHLSPLLSLVIGVPVGIIYYLLFAHLFRFTEWEELLGLIKKK